jgi:predicted DNA-binding ribbon-helix-helix protein
MADPRDGRDAASSDGDDPRVPSGLRKRSVTIAGHATSLSLEDVFWRHLKRIADARRLSLAALIAEVDRTRAGNLSSALRVLVVEELEARVASRSEGCVPGDPVSS